MGMGGSTEHDDCASLIRAHRGVRATNWSRSVTHIVVGKQCQNAEKQRILQYAELQGESCRIVNSSWLCACDQVLTSAHIYAHMPPLSETNQLCRKRYFTCSLSIKHPVTEHVSMGACRVERM